MCIWKKPDIFVRDERRFENPSDMKQYLKITSFDELYRQTRPLSVHEQMEEFMFLGLRMMEGISRERFAQTFGTQIEAVYQEVLLHLTEEGLLEKRAGRIYLTERGQDVSNYALAQFLL